MVMFCVSIVYVFLDGAMAENFFHSTHGTTALQMKVMSIYTVVFVLYSTTGHFVLALCKLKEARFMIFKLVLIIVFTVFSIGMTEVTVFILVNVFMGIWAVFILVDGIITMMESIRKENNVSLFAIQCILILPMIFVIVSYVSTLLFTPLIMNTPGLTGNIGVADGLMTFTIIVMVLLFRFVNYNIVI